MTRSLPSHSGQLSWGQAPASWNVPTLQITEKHAVLHSWEPLPTVAADLSHPSLSCPVGILKIWLLDCLRPSSKARTLLGSLCLSRGRVSFAAPRDTPEDAARPRAPAEPVLQMARELQARPAHRVQTRDQRGAPVAPCALTGSPAGPGGRRSHRAQLPLGNASGRGIFIGCAPRSPPLVCGPYFT